VAVSFIGGETEISGKNHQQTLSYILPWTGIELIGTDCTDSCKSNYYYASSAYHL
jgi:hypothetical protein